MEVFCMNIFTNYISNYLKDFGTLTWVLMYWICNIISLGGLTTYICGFKKEGAKATTLPLIIFFFVGVVCSVIKNM